MSTTHAQPATASPEASPPAEYLPPPNDSSDSASKTPQPAWRRWIAPVAIAVVLLLAAIKLGPWLWTALNTVSTDDAYVNSHVTFVAPRITGQVSRVLVDDNYRVKRGDLLVQLDKQPYELDVAVKKAAVESATADLIAARAQTMGAVAQIRSNYFNLVFAIEKVRDQVAALHSNVDNLRTEEANLRVAERDYARNKPLAEKGAVTAEEFDHYTAKLEEARSRVAAAQQVVEQSRAALGLPPSDDLDEIPPDLDQNYSKVRQALQVLIESAAQLGYRPSSWNLTPEQVIAEFYQQDPQGNLDHIYERLMPHAPIVKQAEAKLAEAQAALAVAELNLKYCDIVSEIDGVVTSRNVNPGNNVVVGQSLMAVRSLTDIWVDANFKETQLDHLRIGQPVDLEVDMYGSRRTFKGRISGFTMGTGQTLELLPPQNATGNFIKIVQRLPVRIDLIDYNPDENPLFVGLSVEPYVYYKEQPTGPNAGKFLQEPSSLPRPDMRLPRVDQPNPESSADQLWPTLPAVPNTPAKPAATPPGPAVERRAPATEPASVPQP